MKFRIEIALTSLAFGGFEWHWSLTPTDANPRRVIATGAATMKDKAQADAEHAARTFAQAGGPKTYMYEV